jgi:flagellar basal-body rod modification protein FlgD
MADEVTSRPVWPYYSAENAKKTTTENEGKTLGQDEFLKILMTQLSSQDPMQPMQDTEFIAQMAQFTAVEQMTKVANEVKLLRQSSGISPELIDKQVDWTHTAEDGSQTTGSGLVEGIVIKKGLQYVVVSGKEVPIDEITRVQKPEVKADE